MKKIDLDKFVLFLENELNVNRCIEKECASGGCYQDAAEAKGCADGYEYILKVIKGDDRVFDEEWAYDEE